MVTEDNINEATDAFETQAKECSGTPTEVNDKFDTLLAVIDGASMATTLATFGMSGVLGWLTKDWVEENRQEITDGINGILEKLKEIAEGIAAPILFLGYSNDWGSAKNCATDAMTTQYGQATQMFGTWEGRAATLYRNSRDAQYTALKSMEALCQNVSDVMVELAAAGWTLYTEIAKLVLQFISDVVAAASKLPTIISTGEGVSEIIDMVTGLQKDLVDFIAIGGDFLILQRAKAQSLAGWESSLEGIPYGRWPAATADTFANGTVTDGVNSWSVTYG